MAQISYPSFSKKNQREAFFAIRLFSNEKCYEECSNKNDELFQVANPNLRVFARRMGCGQWWLSPALYLEYHKDRKKMCFMWREADQDRPPSVLEH